MYVQVNSVSPVCVQMDIINMVELREVILNHKGEKSVSGTIYLRSRPRRTKGLRCLSVLFREMHHVVEKLYFYKFLIPCKSGKKS